MRAIILANGPSLAVEDVERCRGAGFVIAVNDAYKLAHWADVLYACDGTWWDYHISRVRGFEDHMWTANLEAARKYGLRYMAINAEMVWSTHPGYIASGGNSGFQAMNLAHNWGYREIILLGFDYALSAAGEHHWFGKHPKEIRKSIPYANWQTRINQAAPLIKASGTRVINCSRTTAIECFERMTINEALAS